MDRNRLGEETSPYLLQHKYNPVHWQPWSAETLGAAHVPVALLITYDPTRMAHAVPSNVERYVNLYQSSNFLGGGDLGQGGGDLLQAGGPRRSFLGRRPGGVLGLEEAGVVEGQRCRPGDRERVGQRLRADRLLDPERDESG